MDSSLRLSKQNIPSDNRKNKLQIALSISAILTLSFLFFEGLYSTFYFRQLENDGSRWVTFLFNSKSWHIDIPYYRFSTLLVQTPTVLWTKLGGSLPVAIWLFCFCYFVYPFLAGFSVYRRVPDASRSDYLYLGFGILFLCIVPSWGFSVSVVNEAIAIAFIFFSYVLHGKKISSLPFALLVVLLCITYEMAILYLLLYVLILFLEKKLFSRFFLISLAGIIYSVFNLFFRIFPLNAHQTFLKTFSYGIPFSLQEINALLFVIFLFLANAPIQKKIYTWILVVICLMFCLLEVIFFTDSGYLGHAYFNRVWSIPISVIIFAAYYFYLKNGRPVFSTSLKFIVLILAVTTLFFDFKQTIASAAFTKHLRTLLNSGQGCSIIDNQDTLFLMSKTKGDLVFLPYLSIANSESKIIKRMLFSDNAVKINEKCNIENGIFYLKTDRFTIVMSTTQNIDFKLLNW